jgi:hypothetical protein
VARTLPLLTFIYPIAWNRNSTKFGPNFVTPHRPTPIGQGRRKGAEISSGYYVSGQRVTPREGLRHWGGAKRRNYTCDSAHFEQLKKKGVLRQCVPKKTFMTKTRVHARRRHAKLSELTGRSAKKMT